MVRLLVWGVPKIRNCNKIPKKRVEATLKNVKDAIASGST
jgi:hypothetical protein